MKPSIRWSLLAVWLVAVVLLATACAARGVSSASASLESEPAPSALALARSASSNLRFDRISVEQGLSHSTVNCILQDSYGSMWFGTSDGLNKYDGYSFTVYKHDPTAPHGLNHNEIKFLHQDQFGALCVGTADRSGDGLASRCTI